DRRLSWVVADRCLQLLGAPLPNYRRHAPSRARDALPLEPQALDVEPDRRAHATKRFVEGPSRRHTTGQVGTISREISGRASVVPQFDSFGRRRAFSIVRTDDG